MKFTFYYFLILHAEIFHHTKYSSLPDRRFPHFPAVSAPRADRAETFRCKRKAETMTVFGEKVKNRRAELRIDQDQLAGLCGVSRRTIVSYETQGKYPREATLRKLASALGVTERYLTNDDETDPSAGINEEPFIQEARDAFGKKGAEEMAAVLSQNEALFAGGTLSEDQKDMFYEAVTKAYFMSKKRAREKFGKKKAPEKEFQKELH